MLADSDDHNAKEAARQMRKWADDLASLLPTLQIEQEQDDQSRVDTPHLRSPADNRTAPDNEAIRALFDAYQELKRLGWRDAMYCPKDATWFDAIEVGSTGIHRCQYRGEWPKGTWWIADDGDLWPSRPVLFRERKESR